MMTSTYSNQSNQMEQMGKIPIGQLYMNARQAVAKKDYGEANKFKNFAYQQYEYCEISVKEFPSEVIKMTVGKNGCNFIAKTEKNNIYAIWWDSFANVIEFWGGSEHDRNNARSQILKNIDINLDLYHNHNGLTIRDLYNQELMMRKHPELKKINGDIEVFTDINGENPITIDEKEFQDEWDMWNAHAYDYNINCENGMKYDLTYLIGGGNYEYE